MFKRWGNVNISTLISNKMNHKMDYSYVCIRGVFLGSFIRALIIERSRADTSHSWNPWHFSFFFFPTKWWNWNATTESDGTLSCQLLKHRVWIGAVFMHGCAQIHFPLTRGVYDKSLQSGLIWNEINSKGDILVLFCSNPLILIIPGEEMYHRTTDQLWKFRATVVVRKNLDFTPNLANPILHPSG